MDEAGPAPTNAAGAARTIANRPYGSGVSFSSSTSSPHRSARGINAPPAFRRSGSGKGALVAKGGGESKKTVLIALGANLSIAVVKGIGGLLSGSSALLAEAAHSVADTTNQGLILVSLSRSDKPPDEEHPFGYGKERFFWVLLAAIFIFVSGGIFSILEGLYRVFLESGGEEKTLDFVISYGVLVFALVAEGISLVRAVRQTRGQAREAGLGFVEFVRVSKEPAVKTVVSEDTAAVAGVLIAIAGVGLHQLTGDKVYDGAAAILIGILLCFVGYALGRDTKGLLLGEPARPEERERLRETIAAHDEVEAVVELLTMYVGPHSLLVAVRLDFRDDVAAGDVERRLEPDRGRAPRHAPGREAGVPRRDRAVLATALGEREHLLRAELVPQRVRDPGARRPDPPRDLADAPPSS